MDHTRALTRIAGLSVLAGVERENMAIAIKEAAGLFKTEMASLFHVSEGGDFKHLSGIGLSPTSIRKLEEVGNSGWLSSLLGDSLAPVVVENALENPSAREIRAWATLLDAATIAFARVQSDGRTLGVLVFYHRTPYSYRQEECDLLQIVAALLAGMVGHATTVNSDVNSASKSQLFSVLSHELRTPLTSIMGFTQLIRKRLVASGTGDQRMMEQLDVLWAQAQRLNRLIDTFVDMSRIERGEFEIAPGKVELLDLLSSASSQAVAQASSRHKIDLEVPDEALWMHGDGKRLEQVFSHVISNSIRYSPHDQPIKVSCRHNKAAHSVVIKVVDRGPGIPSSRLKEIFGRNYPSGPLKSGGLGVGLYLSKVIVEAHGGQISVDSATNRGTTVSIELPV